MRADEQAKDGAMLDGGDMAQIRAGAALQCAAFFFFIRSVARL